jgi:hypothetical protein
MFHLISHGHPAGRLPYRWECAIELLVYDERGELQEALAIKKGESRKLDLLPRHRDNQPEVR